MKRTVLTALLALTFVAVTPTVNAADRAEKFALFAPPKKGHVQRWKIKAELSIGGTEVKVTGIQKKVTTDVKPNVEFTQSTTTESSRITINGEETSATMADSTAIFHFDGSFKKSADPETDATSSRNDLITAIHLTPTPRAEGETWDVTFEPETLPGTKKVKQSFKFLALEEVAGRQCAKVSFLVQEESEESGEHSGILWIDLRTAERVRAKGRYQNIPWPGVPVPASGSYEIEVIVDDAKER